MVSHCSVPMPVFVTMVVMALSLFCLHSAEAQIGVCYGRNGNNLPSEQQVVNLYKSKGIGFMRLYDPDQSALQALQGSGIQLLLDVPNDQLQNIANNPSQANQWVQNNVAPFASSIRYIAVGNEVQDPNKPFVLPAMQNIQNAINAANLGGKIKVSTAINSAFVANTVPPSNSVFGDTSFMSPIVNFQKSNGSPLLVNIYPYFSYTGDEKDIQLNYALFTAPGTVVTDNGNGLQYQNLFDALVDSVYAALAKAGGSNIPIVVSESGWPSDSGDSATVSNAGTYYRNLINHVKNGTPRKPGRLETYLFAMFDENQKPGAATEQHFGLFTPNQQPKYGQLNFGS
ncbi:glucan endo-1,3-beta-glucosidase-like [Silene latifolia]|uniref:glucan endo-1,3-beta-glucosidase-like n=1 Tax=Silene latifolia TaxID=37657 RepID=UPI003D77F573